MPFAMRTMPGGSVGITAPSGVGSSCNAANVEGRMSISCPFAIGIAPSAQPNLSPFFSPLGSGVVKRKWLASSTT